MEQLPKIVRQRLRVASKAGVHPDPDLLTAFAEKSLKDRERAQVLQHLAECSDCRNVVSLAVSQSEPVLSTSPARLPWLTWPVLRWGALAACVVVVVGAVTLRYDLRSVMAPPLAQKSVEPLAPPVNLKVESEVPNRLNQKMAGKIPPPSPFESARDFETAGKLAKQRETADTRSVAGAAVMDRLAIAQLENRQLQQNQTAKNELRESGTANAVSGDKPSQVMGRLAATAPASPPAAKAADAEPQTKERNDNLDYTARAMTETVEVEAAPASEMAQTAAEKAKDESRRNESRKKVQNGRAGMVGGMALGDRKADTASAEVAETDSGQYGKLSRPKAKAAPRWTLSTEGAVQRSFDSGRSWQFVVVASNVVFRALTARDSDIWVGGAAGALYHSSDAGEHWTQVKPMANGRPLTADIITVEFTDSQHGRLTTGDHEIWTTSDTGITWHIQ